MHFPTRFLSFIAEGKHHSMRSVVNIVGSKEKHCHIIWCYSNSFLSKVKLKWHIPSASPLSYQQENKNKLLPCGDEQVLHIQGQNGAAKSNGATCQDYQDSRVDRGAKKAWNRSQRGGNTKMQVLHYFHIYGRSHCNEYILIPGKGGKWLNSKLRVHGIFINMLYYICMYMVHMAYMCIYTYTNAHVYICLYIYNVCGHILKKRNHTGWISLIWYSHIYNHLLLI